VVVTAPPKLNAKTLFGPFFVRYGSPWRSKMHGKENLDNFPTMEELLQERRESCVKLTHWGLRAFQLIDPAVMRGLLL
jgi:hypothetical protein